MFKTKRGNCEICDDTSPEVDLFMSPKGNMLLCKAHYDSEQVAIAASNKQVVDDARARDAALQQKQDIFTAGTVSLIEIQAAITNNPDIPVARKNYAMMEEVDTRIKKLDSLIFEADKILKTYQNERHPLIIEARKLVATLSEKEREKYSKYGDINYKPTKPKSIKPGKAKDPASKAAAAKKIKFNMKELKAACDKYHVQLSQVQMMVENRGITPEQAAKRLAEQLGLL